MGFLFLKDVLWDLELQQKLRRIKEDRGVVCLKKLLYGVL